MVTCRKQKAVEKPRTEGTSEYWWPDHGGKRWCWARRGGWSNRTQTRGKLGRKEGERRPGRTSLPSFSRYLWGIQGLRLYLPASAEKWHKHLILLQYTWEKGNAIVQDTWLVTWYISSHIPLVLSLSLSLGSNEISIPIKVCRKEAVYKTFW
jgi:hypothetical protein